MRVSKRQAAENRARILAETARLIREDGIAGVGVDALTRAAGLTHGGLYSQFGSKERLVTEALDQAMATSAEKTLREIGEGGTLATIAARYLSPGHRDARGSGCAIAAIGPEAARQGGGIRRSFTRGVEAFAGRLARIMPERNGPDRGGRDRGGPDRGEPDRGGQRAEDAALAAVATLVGALMLARTVDDPDLSDRILAAARQKLAAE